MSKETDVILTEIKGVDTDFTGYFWHFYNNITLNLYDQTIKSVNWYDQTNKSVNWFDQINKSVNWYY
jgi:predicted GTPase